MKPPIGAVVHADFGQGKEEGIVVAHGPDKDFILPARLVEQLGYREPGDRDAHGSGRTYWTEDE